MEVRISHESQIALCGVNLKRP